MYFYFLYFLLFLIILIMTSTNNAIANRTKTEPIISLTANIIFIYSPHFRPKAIGIRNQQVTRIKIISHHFISVDLYI